jgi:hypothetical protein
VAAVAAAAVVVVSVLESYSFLSTCITVFPIELLADVAIVRETFQ